MFTFGKNQWSEDFESKAYSHAAKLYRLAFARLGNAQDAEDAVQDTYIKAYRSFRTFNQGANLEAWLVTILINNIRDHLRRVSKMSTIQRITDSEDFDIADKSFGPEEKFESVELTEIVLHALKTLPETMSMPLLLREIHDMTYKDISTVLDVPIGTVMSRLSRARQLLRQSLSTKLERQSIQPLETKPVSKNAED